MSLKILVIDDNEDDRIAVRFALRDSGHNVETAPGVARGLMTAELLRPDVILLDYSMHDSNGIEFISRLKESYPGEMPAIIMLTGVGNELVAVQALRAGACDYVIKDVGGHYLKLLPSLLERVERECSQRRASNEAERQLQLAASVYANISEGVVVTSTDGMILSVNPALCHITGYAADELIGNRPSTFKSNRHAADFYEGLWHDLIHEGQWRGEIWNRRKDGSLFLARETITAILDTEGHRLNYVAVMTDISDSKIAEETLRQRAYHDELTELPNRSLFLDRLNHRIAYAQRYRNLLAVLFIDLDRFKPVNDDLGHERGDDLLRQVAGRLRECVRESDTVARWGGDEFTVLLNDLDTPKHADQIARKIVGHLQAPFTLDCYEVSISASIGIAIYPEDGTDVRHLIQAADSAMYLAKNGGGSRCQRSDRMKEKTGGDGAAIS